MANLVAENQTSSSVTICSQMQQEYQDRAARASLDTNSTSTSGVHCFERKDRRISTSCLSTSSTGDNSGVMDEVLLQVSLLSHYSKWADASENISYDGSFVTSPNSNNQSTKWCELMPLSHAMREFENKQEDFEPNDADEFKNYQHRYS
ncbi:hypothetical protein O6H91_14G056600 [Diphasiastrum complanatum]|uniref:Uncharacterized protein n=1 Tax=Diphasiastrum complanatum TaxID=34168 RepID=A0ACC2BPJ7_DIPCM|nr:hypothetical protein O6H91_Y366600 [Diphasiastrum complanatum]KAJ7531733.1 hypothetical protein O6H91_14G056600 [Diphasiastrum complanatum]